VDLLQYDALRLFVERAREIAPAFTITAQNRHPIVEVCRRLDGMPLALELAAARMRLLSAQQIADRLNDCFRLLTGGSRAGLARHQTLRATLDWSHRLLSDPERILFRRLAVFAGGFSLAAAESICGDTGNRGPGTVGPDTHPPSPDEVLDLLGQLVDKSLVAVEEQGNEPCFRLLETIRQYARERLAESGEAAATQARHRAWYVALAEQAGPAVRGAQQKLWLDRLQAEHENLRLALASALENDLESALRLAGNLWRFWADRGYLTEGRHWLERALAAPSASGPRGRALMGLGILSHFQGDQTTARAALDESVAIFRERGDTWHLGTALVYAGAVASHHGDRQSARELYEASLAIQRKADDKQGAGATLSYLGRHHAQEGNGQLARALLDQGLGLSRATGDLRGVGWSLRSLGELARREGDWRRATELLKESLGIARDLGHGQGIAGAIDQLGRLAVNEGKHARAVRLQAAVTTSELSRFMGAPNPGGVAQEEAGLTEARAALGEDAFTSAWAEGEEMSVEQAIVYALSDDTPEG
jgi:tetratricopeptide (TPR) repeat protein